MKRIFQSLLVLSVVSSSVQAGAPTKVAPETVGLSAEGLDRLTAALKAEIAAERLPGAVIAVARQGQLAYFENLGYRDAATKAPMPPDAIFSIASMTKPMVSVAIMMLHDEGKLMLTDPIGKFLPALAKMQVGVVKADGAGKETVDSEPATRPPTIQDLLRHTSGIIYGGSGTTAVHKMWPSSSVAAVTTYSGPEFVEAVGKLPLLFQPGTVWSYGLSTEVLGLVVEAISGKTLGAFLEERIWKPLGMTDTSFALADAKKDRYALAFPEDPISKRPHTFLHTGKPMKFECGGACAASTAMDFLRFSQMLLNGGVLDGKRLLSRKTVELMAADHLPDDVKARINSPFVLPGHGFGLGFMVRTQAGAAAAGTVGEYGWLGAFGTYFVIDPKEQLVIVYMGTSQGLAVFGQHRQIVKNIVMQSILD